MPNLAARGGRRRSRRDCSTRWRSRFRDDRGDLRDRRASASPSPTPVTPRRHCSATPTPRCIGRSTTVAARAVVFQSDDHGAAVDRAARPEPIFTVRSNATSSSCTISPSSRCGRGAWSASRRCYAGTTPNGADPARRLHPVGGGHRPHRAHRRRGCSKPCAARLGPLAGSPRVPKRRRRPRDERQPLAPPARRTDARVERRPHPRRDGSIPTRCASNSPRTC